MPDNSDLYDVVNEGGEPALIFIFVCFLLAVGLIVLVAYFANNPVNVPLS